jgi:hypothetical protein
MDQANKQTNVDTLRFVIYPYSPTCFGRFCGHNRGVIQKYKQHTIITQNA